LAEKDKLALLVIAGPTAVGKSDLALAVAREIGGEIISCDSAQVYRGLDIGTAKLLPKDRAGIPHHLIDIAEPAARFTVADFQAAARAAIADVAGRGRLPIVVGGTGLWLRSLTRGFEFPAEAQENHGARLRIEQAAGRFGWEAIRRAVRMVDPVSFARIGPQDRRRLTRALEVWLNAGQRIARGTLEEPYRVSYWVLTRPIGNLHERIRRRAETMLQSGLIDEVRALLEQGVPRHAQSLTAIGYRETVDYLWGLIARAELGPLIIRHTEQLVKRQLTWFRSESDAHWLDLSAWGEDRAVRQIVAAAERLREPGTRDLR
jgi:tRNA dimethylallyltransferase